MDILKIHTSGTAEVAQIQQVKHSIPCVGATSDDFSSDWHMRWTMHAYSIYTPAQIGQEGNSKLSRATSRGTPMRNFYTPYVTEEGVTVQTLLPPLPDAAEAVAGRLQRARAAVAARTRQVHGPLPMPPRKIPPRPLTAASQQLAGTHHTSHDAETSKSIASSMQVILAFTPNLWYWLGTLMAVISHVPALYTCGRSLLGCIFASSIHDDDPIGG